MRKPCLHFYGVLAMVWLAHAPLYATVRILSLTPSIASPQPLGTPVTWTATASANGSDQITFQFSTGIGSGLAINVDFNAGTYSNGIWTSQPFTWATIQSEGTYQVQAVAKDFKANQSATKTVLYTLTSLVTGNSAVVNPTANSLVALFSAPPCPVGSQMQIVFHGPGEAPEGASDWKACTGVKSMNFYVAGMYGRTSYNINYQVKTGGVITPGPSPLVFTTGPLPSDVSFPRFTVITPVSALSDHGQRVMVHSLATIGPSNKFVPLATDLSGNFLWYYDNPSAQPLLTRPLMNETMLTIQFGTAWQSLSIKQQLIRVIDLAGNIQKETNTGIIQNQLVALGAADAGPCTVISQPAPVGSACLGAFHHEVMQMTNGNLVAFADIEKIFQAGTQGDTSGLPVDILGDIVFVMNPNLQVIWYWESFQHDGGGTQLDINRPATLNETCTVNQAGCPSTFLMGSGISPTAHDWMHTNSIFYHPQDGNFVISVRNQDWIIKIDYAGGTGNILWRMGLGGDFAIQSTDPYPWFSHQHDVTMANAGAGPMTVFDNGNTRVAPPPIGLGSGDSRGMALSVDETNLTVIPVLSQDLGVYASALGSAQLLTNGNYFFQPGLVNFQNSFGQEVMPTSGATEGSIVYSLEGPTSYRAFRQADMYSPPVP